MPHEDVQSQKPLKYLHLRKCGNKQNWRGAALISSSRCQSFLFTLNSRVAHKKTDK